jgi:hypothetical protein
VQTKKVVPAFRTAGESRFHIKSFFPEVLSYCNILLPGMMADCIADLLYKQLFQSQHVLFLIEMNDVFAKLRYGLLFFF